VAIPYVRFDTTYRAIFRSQEIPITQRIVAIPYVRFDTTYRAHLQESRNPYYPAYIGNSLPTFRDNLSGPIFKGKPLNTKRMLSQNVRNELTTYTVFISPEREAVSGYDSVTKYVRRNYIRLR